MLFKGNNIASFIQLRKSSMLFKGEFYFDKETNKKEASVTFGLLAEYFVVHNTTVD